MKVDSQIICKTKVKQIFGLAQEESHGTGAVHVQNNICIHYTCPFKELIDISKTDMYEDELLQTFKRTIDTVDKH